MVKIIDKKTRNQLIYSDFLKNNEPNLYKILLDKLSLEDSLAKELGIYEKIKNNLSSWINLSAKEWEVDKNKPFVVDESSKNKDNHCELCNACIRIKYKIKNKKNGKILYIGGDCVKKFKKLKHFSDIVTDADSYNRYNELLKKYGQIIVNILVDDANLLEETEIILKDMLYKDFSKPQKKLVKLLKSYIRSNKKFKEDDLAKLIKTYEYQKRHVNEFINKNKNNIIYMPRDIANDIKNNQSKQYEEIIKSIMDNSGQIPQQISSKIKVERYISKFIGMINNKLPKTVNITNVSFGMYIVTIRAFSDNYLFKIGSELLLTNYYKNNIINFDNIFLSNIDDVEIYDKNTFERLKILGESFILRRSFNIYEINYAKIAREYDNDLTGKEFNNLIARISRTLDSYTAFKRKNDNKIYLFNNSNLVNIGKNVLLDFHKTFSQQDIIGLSSYSATADKLNEFMINYIK